MVHLLIPHEASANAANIWLAVADGPVPAGDAVLHYGQDRLSLDAAGWQHWASQSGRHVLHYRTVALQGLAAATSYPLAWRIQDEVVADGSVTTLPERLPALDEPPFTIMLTSCFSARRRQSALAGASYFHLPHGRRPVLKLHCGDQVYLDDPVHYFLVSTHSEEQLENLFFETYLATWGQGENEVGSGFNEILKSGANYFSPDDHELWNNAPNPATLIQDTWRSSGRRAWQKAAKELYRIFQADRLLTSFEVGELAFLVVDTRMERAPGSKTFLPAEDMARAGAWVRGLTGPGVLVLAQPIFEKAGGWFSQRLVDRVLPDYAQYADLVAHLASSRHSIVILTGDVHYGRLARCVLRDDVEIVEVVSSPLALVHPWVGGDWHPAPSLFPASASGAPIGRRPVLNYHDWNSAHNHFVTLEFAGVGDSVRMAVRDWRIGDILGEHSGHLVETLRLR
jgi:hypothetical protein